MRRYNVPEAYGTLKELTRGRVVRKESIRQFIDALESPEKGKVILQNLTPQSYIGEAEKLATATDDYVDLANGFRLL